MRIRKNGNNSSFTFSHVLRAEQQQPYLCSLNQSPWDVTPYPSSPINQFAREDIFNGNVSLGDSILAGDSLASMEEAEVPTLDSMVIDDKKNKPIVKESKKKKVNMDRSKTPKKRPVISYNPNEIYYYSGFGPSWSKRRGNNKVEEKKTANEKESNLDAAAASITMTSTSNVGTGSQNTIYEELDYIDDDEESGENGGDRGNKRMRKPIKARSLKSLMQKGENNKCFLDRS